MRKQRKPNFFIIGAPKAATTSLASLLQLHPDAAIVRQKEPHFFSYDHVFRQGWKGYLGLYSHCVNQKAIGDASTSYSRIRQHPATIARIHEYVPRAKIIYMIRHPLQRMESAYVEHLGTSISQVFASLNDAVKRQPMIVDSSRYWEVYDAYRQRFGETRIKIVWFEDYTTRTTEAFQDVCRFLQIDDTVVPDLERARTNNRDDALSRKTALGRGDIPVNTLWDEETRQWVITQLREDNCRFLEHFGKPRDYWADLY
jgi:hypothetical protein